MSLLHRRMMMTNTENGGSEMAEWKLIETVTAVNDGDRLRVQFPYPVNEIFMRGKLGATTDGRNFTINLNDKLLFYHTTYVSNKLEDFVVMIKREGDCAFTTFCKGSPNRFAGAISNWLCNLNQIDTPITSVEIFQNNLKILAGSTFEIYAR